MQPVVDRLGEAYRSQVKFVKLDANGDGKSAFQAARLPGHPAYVVFLPDGQEAWRGFGLVDEANLEAAIRSVLE